MKAENAASVKLRSLLGKLLCRLGQHRTEVTMFGTALVVYCGRCGFYHDSEKGWQDVGARQLREAEDTRR